MKKYIHFTLISLFILGAFISCDNDASSGILSNIINSEEETTYNIKAVAKKDANTFYSLEDDGIYKTTNSDPNVRSLVLNTSEYYNIENIYYNNSNSNSYLYFICNNESADKKVLYYFDTNEVDPNPIEITIDDTLIALSSNGYVLFKNTTNYFYKKINEINEPSPITTDSATNTEISIDESLASIVPVGDDALIIQTSAYNSSDEKYIFNYHIVDNSVISNNVATDQEKKIVSAVLDDSGYFAILSDGDLIKIDNLNTISLYYNNESSTYSFNNKCVNMHFLNNYFLALVDSSNNVLLYNLDNSDEDDGFFVLNEGFANLLNNTSDIVYISIANYDNSEYKLYVATNSNGYYTITIDDANILDQNNSDNSSYTDYLEEIN